MNVIPMILLGLLSCAVYTDMTSAKISNRLIVSGLIMGFLYQIFWNGESGILCFAVNIVVPVILLYLLFQMHVLGAGDIKLFSMLGAFLSIEELLKLIVLSFLAGAVMGICKLTYLFVFQRKKPGKLTQIHFSPAIFIAYILIQGGGVWQT